MEEKIRVEVGEAAEEVEEEEGEYREVLTQKILLEWFTHVILHLERILMEPASKLWKQSAGRRHGQAVGMVVRRPSYLQKVPKPLEDKGKILSGLIFFKIYVE